MPDAADEDKTMMVPARHHHRADRLGRLLERLPRRIRDATHRLLAPQARWARIPVGLLLILGGIFSFLPLLGIWMLPLGLILLAEDVPVLHRLRERGLDWIERHRPHWIHGRQARPDHTGA